MSTHAWLNLDFTIFHCVDTLYIYFMHECAGSCLQVTPNTYGLDFKYKLFLSGGIGSVVVHIISYRTCTCIYHCIRLDLLPSFVPQTQVDILTEYWFRCEKNIFVSHRCLYWGHQAHTVINLQEHQIGSFIHQPPNLNVTGWMCWCRCSTGAIMLVNPVTDVKM